MTNGRRVKSESNNHINELLSFIDNSLDAYTKESNSAQEDNFDSKSNKKSGSEEHFIALKRKVLRLKKSFATETSAREGEIESLREAVRHSSERINKLFFFAFSWLLFLTFLSLYNWILTHNR